MQCESGIRKLRRLKCDSGVRYLRQVGRKKVKKNTGMGRDAAEVWFNIEYCTDVWFRMG